MVEVSRLGPLKMTVQNGAVASKNTVDNKRDKTKRELKLPPVFHPAGRCPHRPTPR